MTEAQGWIADIELGVIAFVALVRLLVGGIRRS
jgi:hypothetical protein